MSCTERAVAASSRSTTVRATEPSNRRRASTALVGEIQAGDWVVIAGGAIVRRVEADQAEMMARAFRTATGIDVDDDLDDERHHYPTEDPDTAPARHPHKLEPAS